MSKNSGAQNKRAVLPTHSAHVSLELLFCTPSYFSLNHLLNTAFTDVCLYDNYDGHISGELTPTHGIVSYRQE